MKAAPSPGSCYYLTDVSHIPFLYCYFSFFDTPSNFLVLSVSPSDEPVRRIIYSAIFLVRLSLAESQQLKISGVAHTQAKE